MRGDRDFLGRLVDRGLDLPGAIRPRPVAIFEAAVPDVPPKGPASRPVEAASPSHHAKPGGVPARRAPDAVPAAERQAVAAPAPTPPPPAALGRESAAAAPPPLVRPELEGIRPQPVPPPPEGRAAVQPVRREVILERRTEVLSAAERPRPDFPEPPAAKVEPQRWPVAEVPHPSPAPAEPLIEPLPVPAPLREERVRRESGGSPPAARPPTIHVTIGRVEVRASPPAAAPARRRSRPPAVMSLDDYLKQRAGGGKP